MQTVPQSIDLAQGDIYLLGERWQRLHRTAMNDRDWEEIATRGAYAFRLLMEAEKEYRNQLGRDEIEYDPSEDVRFYTLFLVWLRIAEQFKSALAASPNATAERAENFPKCLDDATMIRKAMEGFVERHADAVRELERFADNLEQTLTRRESEWHPSPSDKIADLLLDLRTTNIRDQDLDEEETATLCDLREFPGTILGELLSRRYRHWPTVTRALWAK